MEKRISQLVITVLLNLMTFFLCYGATDEYKGSQAYNHEKLFHAQVNIATGTFSFSYPLINVPGIREPLDIQLTYHFNATGMFGLPQGWRINLDYIADNTAELGGKQWLIDNLWHDETGYASGLRYYNQHGTQFIDKGESHPIPNDKQIYYRYKTTYKDGSTQYFSHQGLLVLRTDRFNNAVKFVYQQPVSSLTSARLDHIIDNYGHIYRFDYDPQSITINYPDGRKQQIYFNDKGVSRIIDPMQQAYELTYTTLFGHHLIRTITTPEGLLTDLAYDSIPYTASNRKKEMPVVLRFTQSDLADHKIHHDMHYQYSKGNNYTGYPKYALSDQRDALMESDDQAYRYAVNVTRTNANQIHQQVYEYNYLHLPTEVRTLHAGKPFTKTTYQYEISPFKYSRSTNYDKPINVTHWVWHDNSNGYVPYEKIDTQYDNYANKTHETHSVFETSTGQWKRLSKLHCAYYNDHFSLIKVHTYEDALSGRAIQKRYQLAESGMTHSQESQQYKSSHDQKNWAPWQQITLTFDEKGRKQSTTKRWLAANKPGVKSMGLQIHYTDDLENHLLEISTISDGGREKINFIDTRNGQKLKTRSPKGEFTTFSYDKLNRQLTQTDPEGHVIETRYEVFEKDQRNTVTHRSPMGEEYRSQFDASHRLISYEDRYKGQWRHLFSQTYNTFGQVTDKRDRLGRVTTATYDEHNRPIQLIDPFGNVHRHEYNDQALSTTTFINDRKRKTITKKPAIRTTLKHYFPVTDNPHEIATEFVEKTETDDGFDQRINESTALIHQVTQAVSNKVKKTYQYDASQQLIVSSIDTFDEQSVQKHLDYDLGGKLYSWKKTYQSSNHTNVHDGYRYTTIHEGYRYHHDADGLLYAVESPPIDNGDRLSTRHQYDKNGQEIQRTLQDGSTIDYQYNSRGLLITRTWQRDQHAYQVHQHYDNDGKLVAVSDNDHALIQYHYDENGALVNIDYPDKRFFRQERDAYGRLSRQTDANGTEQQWIYDPDDQGQLSQIIMGSNKVHLHYGKDQNGKKGQLLQQDVEASGTGLTQTQYTYGAWGQVIQSSSINQPSETAFTVDYTYDALGDIQHLSQVLKHKTAVTQSSTIDYSYDGLRRLYSEQHRTGGANYDHTWKQRYEYDGNANLLTEQWTQSGRTIKNIQYHYNNLDQLVDMTIEGDIRDHSLNYDRNGRLIQDHVGQEYHYDTAGYLLSVSAAEKGQETHYHYWPNGVLGRITQGETPVTLYADQTHSVQTLNQDDNWQSLLRHDKNILGFGTPETLNQTFVSNQSLGAYLHRIGTGDPSYNTQTYDAYGQVVVNHHSTPDALRTFGWNQAFNQAEPNLTYFQHRFYSPSLRRFISRDSLNVDNRYAYAWDNPVNFTDPTGYSPVLNYTLGTGFTALGIIGAVLAIPTGGASLEIYSIAAIGAGVASGLSGMSLIGSQAALDAGNTTVAKALSVTSIALSVLGIGQVTVSLAPTISNAFAQASRFFSASTEELSAGVQASAGVESPAGTSPAPTTDATGGVHPTTAVIETEAVVSGWSIATTVTENTIDLTTDIFADQSVGDVMGNVTGRKKAHIPSQQAFMGDRAQSSQQTWLTALRRWMFKQLSPDDISALMLQRQIMPIFSEESLKLLSVNVKN